MPTWCGRFAWGAIRTARPAWSSTSPASRATACIPSTARTASSSIAFARGPSRRNAARRGSIGAFPRAGCSTGLARQKSGSRVGPCAPDARPRRAVQRCATRAARTRRRRSPRPTSPPAAPPMPARPPTTNLAGGFSIARQLGLGVSRIVIDPGHGGHDPGATGRGMTEAELVLDIALRLEQLLAKIPGVEVVLTRRTDTYVPLEERTADCEPRRRGPVSLDPRERQPQHAGPRRRNLLPQLRQQPERRSGRRARERGVRAGDGAPCRIS